MNTSLDPSHGVPSGSWENAHLAAIRDMKRALHRALMEQRYLEGRAPEPRPFRRIPAGTVKQARDSIVLRCELGERAYRSLMR